MALDPVALKSLALELVAAMPPAPSREVDGVDFDPIDSSHRARTMRAILRVADSYGWRSAITHFLDTKGVSHLSDLTQPQLDDLLDRMHGYVDAAEMGACPIHCLPAD